MGSKRPKRSSKQELELFPDKNNIKRNKEKDDPAEPDISDINVENDAVVPAVVPVVVPTVVPKAPKRKKKNEGIDEVPKKLKKINDNGNNTKKARPRKRRSKSDSILSTEGVKTDIVPAMNGEAKLEIPQNNIPKVKNNQADKDKKKEDISWPDQDINELISRMETNIPEKDMLAYRSRVEKLNWNNVAFKDYTAEQCKSTWMLVQKRIRRFRLLTEILNDAKEWIRSPRTNHSNSRTNHKSPRPKKHPDMPRRPLSSYLLFYLKTKDQVISENPGLDGSDITKLVGQIYKNLPPETREKYEKLAATNKEEYLEKLKIFFENHPEFGPPPKANHKADKDKAPKVEKEKAPKPPPKTAPKVEKPPKPEKEKATKSEKPKPKGERTRGRPAKSGNLKERPPKKCQTPFGLFYNSELKSMEPGTEKQAFREKCKLQYKQMPDKKKMYWITLAEQDLIRYQEEVRAYRAKYPEFRAVKVRPILTKKEKVAKERASGKPVKPPNSAYALYSRVMLQSDEIKTVHPKERMNYIANKWKSTSEDEKKTYGDQVVTLNDDYKQQYQSFLNSLPEDERRKLMPQSKRKSGRRSRSGRVRKAKKRKSVKKENKPPPPPKLKFTEPEQPPISACKYFATLYKGEGDAVQAWKALPPEQKRQYEDELVKKKQAYIVEFERFLKSLSKEELEAFSKSRQQQVKSDEDESSECSSGSEGDDEDDDEDEENAEENGEENEEENGEENSENVEDVHNKDKDVHESDTD